MVGNKTGIAEMTAKYVGKPFSACSCMKLVKDWFDDLGFNIPESFEDMTLDNYMAAWKADRAATIEKMFRFFNTLGNPVEDFTSLSRHDLLAVEENENTYAAIYLGNNMIISGNLYQGIRVLYLGKINVVVMARRLVCQA